MSIVIGIGKNNCKQQHAPSAMVSCRTATHLGDSCYQNFHFGRYIIGYTVRILVLLWGASRAVKRDFQTYIWLYTSPNENYEYGYPHSNALLQSHLKLEPCKLHKAACRPTKCDLNNDVKLFLTVYCRIYWRKFLTLSNQMKRYKRKCIRITICILMGFFLLVWCNKLQIVHCTYLGFKVITFKKNSVFFCRKIFFNLNTNSVDPDEMQHYAAFHLGLHCLQK